jgi:hypothetical protein
MQSLQGNRVRHDEGSAKTCQRNLTVVSNDNPSDGRSVSGITRFHAEAGIPPAFLDRTSSVTSMNLYGSDQVE